MNHSFISSQLNSELCATCKRREIDHGNLATCESCDNVETCELVHDILMCSACQSRQQEIDKELEERESNPFILKKDDLDITIRTRAEFFNSRMVSINELATAIDNDPTIENKQFELSARVRNRLEKLRNVIYPERKTELEATVNEYRALMEYLSELAKKLTAEERAKLKLQDANYVPVHVKTEPIRKIKTKKWDKAELKKYAEELKVPEYTLQAMVIAQNKTVAEVAQSLRELYSQYKKD